MIASKDHRLKGVLGGSDVKVFRDEMEVGWLGDWFDQNIVWSMSQYFHVVGMVKAIIH